MCRGILRCASGLGRTFEQLKLQEEFNDPLVILEVSSMAIPNARSKPSCGGES
jgi:hypothetical protein